MQGFEIGRRRDQLAKFRRLIAVELQAQAGDRGLRLSDLSRARVDENAENHTERCKPRDDRRSGFDRNLPFARTKNETDGVGARFERATRVLVGGATADLDAGQRSAGAGTALIPTMSSAGSSARISVSPIKNPRAPAATSARVSWAE